MVSGTCWPALATVHHTALVHSLQGLGSRLRCCDSVTSGCRSYIGVSRAPWRGRNTAARCSAFGAALIHSGEAILASTHSVRRNAVRITRRPRSNSLRTLLSPLENCSCALVSACDGGASRASSARSRAGELLRGSSLRATTAHGRRLARSAGVPAGQCMCGLSHQSRQWGVDCRPRRPAVLSLETDAVPRCWRQAPSACPGPARSLADARPDHNVSLTENSGKRRCTRPESRVPHAEYACCASSSPRQCLHPTGKPTRQRATLVLRH